MDVIVCDLRIAIIRVDKRKRKKGVWWKVACSADGMGFRGLAFSATRMDHPLVASRDTAFDIKRLELKRHFICRDGGKATPKFLACRNL